MTYISEPFDEVAGLHDALVAATTGVISRAVTVRDRAYDGFWPGPWPLIELPDFTWRLDRLFGGASQGGKGQDPRRPSFYTVTLADVIDLRLVTLNAQGIATSTLIADAQTDLLMLIGAIAVYFDTPTNACLPDGNGVARARRAGEHMEFKMATYRSQDGGEARVVAAGRVSVLGLNH